MEISSQHMDELFRIGLQQPSQTTAQKKTGSADQFDTLLQQAITQQHGRDTTVFETPMFQNAGQADMISKMLLHPLNQDQSGSSESMLLQNAYDNASGTLDLWDSYTKTLGSSMYGNSLRDAYSILETIGSQVAQLKTNAASMPSQDKGLNSIINELDIMATTERIKFNRGDYAAYSA